MTQATAHDRRVLKADLMFGVLGVASVVTLIAAGFDNTPAIEPSADPWLLGGVLIVTCLVLSLIFARGADIDRRCSEEYSFQLIANAAVVGVVVTLLANMLLSFDFLFGRWFEAHSADHLVGFLMGAWATGYFIFRIRGTAA